MEIDNNNNNIHNQIFLSDNNSELIQNNSFRDYFISILGEIPDFFKLNSISNKDANIQRYLNPNIDNKSSLELLPISSVDPAKFIEEYTKYVNLIHKKPNKIPYFTKFEKNEIQLLYLLYHTLLADEKIDKYIGPGVDVDVVDAFTNNHLIKINNIIKTNSELIGYVYILKWLQKIITLSYEDYNDDKSLYDIINNKKPIQGENNDPIALEEKCVSNKNEEYNNLMKQFIYCLFKGNIYQCQLMCDQRKIEEFGNIFSGGCPLFDKVISNETDYNNFDIDLISPSMYNKEYQEFTELINAGDDDGDGEGGNNNEKNTYGNSFYILWLKVIYENADYSKNNTLLNTIFRLVSGNYKKYELTNNNVYEYLYINVLNLLHSQIFNELTQNSKHKMIQYHYIENESFKEISQVVNNGGRNINSVIDSIIQNNNYSLLTKEYPFLWLELYFIKLFFIKIQIKESIKNNNNNNINISELYKKYFDGLNAIINVMKKGNDSFNIEYEDIFNNEREFNYSSLNNRKLQMREFYDMVNICLYRAFFSSLTTFYSIEKDFIDYYIVKKNINSDVINTGEIIEQIFNSFDDIYCNYIKQIINLISDNLNFEMILYVTAYMFNIKSIIFILTEISHYINSNEKYRQFIKIIKCIFDKSIYNGESLSAFIIKIITNNSNLLKITDNLNNKFNCIDDALNYYVQLKMENILNYNHNNNFKDLSDNDNYKINQILCLFTQTQNNKLNIDTSYSYLLKLFIKFLINYKYEEAYELKYQLKDYIYEEDAPVDELIIEKIPEISQQVDKIEYGTDPDIVQNYTILTNRYLFIIILDCFYFYANKIIIPYNKLKNGGAKNIKNYKDKSESELSQNVVEFIEKKIYNLNKFIKIIIGNEILYNYTLNYYGEDTKKEYIKLLGDWAFQTIKWMCDVFNLGIIDKNKYDSLKYILDEFLYDKNMMNQYYLMNGFNTSNNAYDSDNMIQNRERKLADIMDDSQRQKVVDCIYQMAKINQPYLKECLDAELTKKLNDKKTQVLQELDFDFDLDE
jgi:hypothetical protein